MPAEKVTKIIYKGAENTEFFILANAGMVDKYKQDKSIPLVDVVQSFEVFTTSTGSNTGEVIHPPKGLLESTFNTANKDDIVKKIIEHGEEHGY